MKNEFKINETELSAIYGTLMDARELLAQMKGPAAATAVNMINRRVSDMYEITANPERKV